MSALVRGHGADTDIIRNKMADMERTRTSSKMADTDINFFKIRGHEHDTDNPRTSVSTELCLRVTFR